MENKEISRIIKSFCRVPRGPRGAGSLLKMVLFLRMFSITSPAPITCTWQLWQKRVPLAVGGILLLPLVLLSNIFLFSGSYMNAQTRRALLVGINNYEPKVMPKPPCRSQWSNLRGCINDVEAMKGILTSSLFDFKPEYIHVLKNETATKAKILADFRRYLIDNTSPGDICLFYYSGHGSRVKNSKSEEPDRMDETLVPADWYRGVGDIHDKELKKLFNRVLDKKAHLTVIVDACHSGSISKGIPVPRRYRSLPPNQYDIAQPSDNKKSPAERGALIFSAAQDFQGAVETRDANKNWHGLFTWALVKALQNFHGDASAQDVILKTKALMQSECPSQVPNLEGLPHQTQRSILGIHINGVSDPLKIAVSRVKPPLIELLGGLALGIRKDCQLKKVVEKNKDAEIRVQVTAMHGLNRCTSKILPGKAAEETIKVGDFFELDKWVAPRAARMQICIPATPYSQNQLTAIARNIEELQEFNHIHWVRDPTELNPTHIISWQESSWILQIFKKGDRQIVDLGRNPQKDVILKEILKNPSGSNIKPRVFLQLPLSVELEQRIRQALQDYNHFLRVSTSGEGSHYILVGRYINQKLLREVQGAPRRGEPIKDGFVPEDVFDNSTCTCNLHLSPLAEKSPPGRRRQKIQYSWVLPNMTQDMKKDFMLPIRTDWMATKKSESGLQQMAEKVTDKILQLVRIRAWLQLSSPPGNRHFPYQLALKNFETGAITFTGPLIQDEIYGLVLKADKSRLESVKPIQKRYVYVFSIDSYGKGTLLFPPRHRMTAENYFPVGSDDILEEIELGSKKAFRIKAPFGVDTFILITTTDALLNPGVLDFAGIRPEPIKGKLTTPLDQLFFDLSSLSRSLRHHLLPMDWSIQRLPIFSQAKK